MHILDKLIDISTRRKAGWLHDAVVPVLMAIHTHKKIPRWPRLPSTSGSRISGPDREQFFLIAFSLLGKFETVRGINIRDTIPLIQDFVRKAFRLNDKEEREALRIFSLARSSQGDLQSYAKQYYLMFRHQPKMLTSMVHTLLYLAYSGSGCGMREQEIIRELAQLFGLSDAQYTQLANYRENIHRQIEKLNEVNQIQLEQQEKVDQAFRENVRSRRTPLDEAYELLGCSRDDALITIESKYRDLVFEYHPDRLAAQGHSEEFLIFTRNKFEKILKAYNVIRKEQAGKS